MKPQVEQELAHILLTELLAYQFASPVRWIETQDVFLRDQKTERVVEIGPSPTLAGMAQRTLRMQYQGYDAALSMRREVLSYAKDQKIIYYEDEEANAPPAPLAEATPAAATPAPAPSAPASAPVAAAPAPAAAGPAKEVEDVTLKPMQVIQAVISHKLKKPVDQIPVSKAVKDLVGGKSTVQNEILGDLGKEFGSAPEKAEEIPLSDLAENFGDSFGGKLGKHTSSLVSRLAAGKMPGGFALSQIRKYLESRWGLGPGRQDAILLLALTKEPAARLGNEADAKSFFDGIVQGYAAAEGIDLSSASSGGAAAAGGGAVVDAAAIEEATKDQRLLARKQLELLANYLRVDLRAGAKKHIAQVQATELLQKELDLWLAEHGDFYAEGIKPIFSGLKSRRYDSYWNWARQDCMRMFFDIVWGRLSSIDREVVSRCISIMNRANPVLIDLMVYYIEHVPTERGETFQLAKDLAQRLLENCKEAVGQDPLYKDVALPTGPHTEVSGRGSLEYSEVQRPACRKLEHYVLEMAQGHEELTKLKDGSVGGNNSELLHLEELYRHLKNDPEAQKALDLLRERLVASASSGKEQKLAHGMRPDIVPYLNLRSRDDDSWKYSAELTSTYLNGLEKGARDGVTFQSKTVLLTGAGKGSIGVKVLEGLLMGGANVVVTTSRFSKETTDFYQDIYTRLGATGSTLVVVPFNQASVQDCKALVNYIYEDLSWDLDFIIPFAAIPEGGIELDGIESKSELAHRLMLTNLLRLLGFVKTQKQQRAIETRPAQVVLPLSPNHGTFGGDGLYSESKLSLETLFNRWHAESWSSYVTVCGAVIGWTRGTGLMNQNNVVAEGMEKELGVRTFSQQEMAFNILGLMTPELQRLCQRSPVYADLNGGMQNVPDLKEYMTKLRANLQETAELRRAVATETAIEQGIINGEKADEPYTQHTINPRANLKFAFPELQPYDKLPATDKLMDLIDLDRVAVITGFSEVGPWGNSRTRWEMEAFGEFSLEGAIEMAWIMGLIKYNAKKGWTDAKSGEVVDEREIKSKYEKHILEHSGIRLTEPEVVGFDPHQKQFVHEVIIEHDLEPFETSKETAEHFKIEQGDTVEAFADPENAEVWTVRFLKGAKILVPKALNYNRFVCGQIPTGWDARTYGVPEDIINQVDPVTLFTLVSTSEALITSGITDPYEFYKYVHVSEVGNASGSGMGGMSALRKMFKDRYLDKEVQNDILQESFINTMSAWVNMLLISSSGPTKTPVGACATAVESVDSGVELIKSGAARVVIVGGYDDIKEEGIQEFGNMNATSNSVTETEHGRTPREMSRPTTTSRSGFMEAQGAGIQILMAGSLAIKMGVPIHGIVALTATATDKIGRSVPAPGKGIMTVAREDKTKSQHLLDISYRRRQLEYRRRQLHQWADDERKLGTPLEAVAEDLRRQERDAQRTWGNDFWVRNPAISPLKGALAQWSLTIDDIGVSSFHGTSTQANDKNESASIHDMLVHLGRSKGNPVLGVFQKYLTGHPKGPAGAWMLNGVLQILNSGIVPGNRNADNVDSILQQYDRIQFPSVTLQTYGIKAGTVTSFGFGQKGGFGLVVHPDYLFSCLDRVQYEEYSAKVNARYDKVYRYWHDAITHNTLFRAKDKAPYTSEQETEVYMNPSVRVEESTLHFAKNLSSEKPSKLEATIGALASSAGSGHQVGVDIELISSINTANDTFIQRNFTAAERDYCNGAADPRASYAGTWSAKEAVFKALKTEGKGAAAPLVDIEIVHTKTGPEVKLHGDALSAANGRSIKVSISHDDNQAAAVAIAS